MSAPHWCFDLFEVTGNSELYHDAGTLDGAASASQILEQDSMMAGTFGLWRGHVRFKTLVNDSSPALAVSNSFSCTLNLHDVPQMPPRTWLLHPWPLHSTRGFQLIGVLQVHVYIVIPLFLLAFIVTVLIVLCIKDKDLVEQMLSLRKVNVASQSGDAGSACKCEPELSPADTNAPPASRDELVLHGLQSETSMERAKEALTMIQNPDNMNRLSSSRKLEAISNVYQGPDMMPKLRYFIMDALHHAGAGTCIEGYVRVLKAISKICGKCVEHRTHTTKKLHDAVGAVRVAGAEIANSSSCSRRKMGMKMKQLS